MATIRPIETLGLDYVRRFTEAYRLKGNRDNEFHREIRCEDVQFPAVLVSPRPSDLLAGKRLYPEVGYSIQCGGLGYYANFNAWDLSIQGSNPSSEGLAEWNQLRTFWEYENTTARCYRAFSSEMHKRLPGIYDGGANLPKAAYPLFRMSGLQLDYGKLVENGISGLRTLLETRRNVAGDEETEDFLDAALASISRLQYCAEHYLLEVKQLQKENSTDNLKALHSALSGLIDHTPKTFHEALQLILLVSTITGTINFGRLDVVLGPYLCRDLDTGVLTWNCAINLMQNFYVILEEEILHFDARIIVGGLGRKNEVEANRFALLAMETTQSLSLPMPQLTLRFHVGQDPALLEKAYDVVGQGKTFPIFYNDTVNVPAVETAFNLDRETAEQYLPFGCGEYMIDHQSCGTPNAIINLQRCLESAINHGQCIRTDEIIGPDYGGLETYADFEALWLAYTRTVDYFLEPLAKAQDSIYRTTGSECPYSLVSILYDDCIERGRPIFNGGIRFLGGTNETYGNNNAADSLTAILTLIYENKSCTAEALVTALKDNWKGHEFLYKKAKSAPKFGNDSSKADSMVERVHEHICKATSALSSGTNLHHFLVVIINNNHNTLWGKQTSASPDGRHHGEPLAPGNAPGAGCDQSGLTAVLNSQLKPDPTLHAGMVQNMKLSSSFPTKYPPLYRILFNTYFQRGGTQAMITVTNREDLLAALKHPEKYSNLLVRVGGFSARFIDLDTATQQEIIMRTEHAA